MSKILVTGGAGFIGSNFVQMVLAEHPEAFIVNLDKLTYAGNLENLAGSLDHPNHKFVKGDICDGELVEKIINLRNVHVGDAMVPAPQVVSVRQDAGADELLSVIGGCRFNRLPVTDASGRDVVGLLAVPELLRDLTPGETADLARFVKPAVVLRPTMTVTQAIFALQRNRAAMAAVRNAEGRYVGIVTLKVLTFLCVSKRHLE